MRLASLVEFADESIVGEQAARLKPVLEQIVAGGHLVSGPSLFGLTARIAVLGESARQSWTMVDEMDSRSQYLHAPSQVAWQLSVYASMLEKLLDDEGSAAV